MFITFEGGDGSGKTTQVAETVAYLRQNGYDVLHTREPGGTYIGDRVRDILLAPPQDGREMAPQTELLLFAASRAQLVHEVIQPHLESDGIVVCDRYIDSTFAYQGYGHGLNLEVLRKIIGFATGGLVPDLTLFLDIPPDVALRRRAAGTLFGEEWNRLDDKALSFHQRVYQGYRELILREPARFVEIDATESQEQVQQDIRTVLAAWLDLPRRARRRA